MTMQQENQQGANPYQQGLDKSSPTTPINPNSKLDPKTEVKVVQWAKSNFKSIKQDRWKAERQWYINMAFYYGRQNVAVRNQSNLIAGVGGSLYVPPAPYYRARPVINRVRTVIRSEMSKLTAQKPTAYILPATSDDQDLFAAQAGEQIWDSMYRAKKIPAVFRRALWWNQVCGNAFIRCAWDPEAVDEISDQMGDICYKAVSPFNVFLPDLSEEDLEEQPYLIYAQLHTEDWVALNWPEAKIQKQSDQSGEIIENGYLDILGATNPENRKGVLCLEVWVKPGKVKLFPQGGMFFIIGESVVEFFEGWPYQHKSYPFAKLAHIPTGKFYTDSTLVDLIPLQREYNRTRGQIIEAKNRMAKPQLVAERGSIEANKITSEPGQVIEYAMGFQPPQPLPLMPIPNYVLQELDRIILDIADISGQHEVSKGTVPPGVTAATAINYLQEQDDSVLSYTFSALEEAYEKVAHQTLSYAQQFWDTPRIVKITGDDEFFDSLMFKGSDLRGNTDIRIEAGSALPLSKSAKQAFIMDLMKMGFIDPMTGLEVMEMGGIAKIYESVQIDVRQAQRENLRLAQIDDNTFQMFEQQGQQGGIIPVNTWDNHLLHIATHDKFRKGQSYDQLSDGAKQAFEMHVQMHKLAYSTGQTGENVMETVKPENLNQPDPNASGSSGDNQFTKPPEPTATQSDNSSNNPSSDPSSGAPSSSGG